MKKLLCLILSFSLLLTGVLPYFAAAGGQGVVPDARQSGRLFAPLRYLRVKLTGALTDLFNRLYTVIKEEPIYHPTGGRAAGANAVLRVVRALQKRSGTDRFAV